MSAVETAVGEQKKRLIIRVYGIVQGVGFRPFVSRAAERCGITGNVSNYGSFVEINAEGSCGALNNFTDLLKNEPPERSSILKTDISEAEPEGFTDFTIIESTHKKGDIFVSPDIATCPKCKAELFDKNNRRYLHPFINCTACGPRLTILDSMPYDRERTSMGGFPMCPECEYEYTHAETRRYDAQPVCCPECGPQLYILGGAERGDDALKKARSVIREGGIAAVKGIGGFHLCCDARNEDAVKRLRVLKHRPFKPFAVMMRDLETVRRECVAEPEEEALLDGHQKPIILLERCKEGLVAEAAAPGNPKIGVMLPYAPVQMLLFSYPDDREMTDCFIMTSGNVSGAPICRSDEDALSEIAGMCDVILSNDRKIRIRADDSVMDFFEGAPYMIRRSRGYAPLPFMLERGYEGTALAVGGELKNTFCLANNSLFYPSPYVGDMGDIRTLAALSETVGRMEELLETQPEICACDMHPGYNTTRWAEKLGLPLIKVQHHYAHILSCMAENDYSGKVIGVSFDGTGYGPDGSIWGGEFLLADNSDWRRIGSIAPFTQAGGDICAKEGWRPAVSMMLDIYGPREAEKAALKMGLCAGSDFTVQKTMRERNLNCIASTSMGRLFDAVSAMLGIKRVSTFEGEASMALEFCASKDEPSGAGADIKWHGNTFTAGTSRMLEHIAERAMSGGDASKLSGAFHTFVAETVLAGCVEARKATGLSTAALSGGVFQNKLLLEKSCALLRDNGFKVLKHSLVPTNDGGVALGQAVAAMEYLKDHRGGK